MIFGFDLDGVVYPWHKYAWEWYVDKTGEKITFDKFWEFPNGLVAINEGESWVKEMVSVSETYWTNPPTWQVQYAVQKIASLADMVWYITSRPMDVKDMTAKWLYDFAFPWSDHLIFADEVGGKYNAVLETRCDYYAEDRPKYLESLSEIADIFIVSTPYNTHKEFDGIRVNHIIEIPNILENLEDEIC